MWIRDCVIDLAAIQMIDLDLEGAVVASTVDGSPILADDRFFGFECPMPKSTSLFGRVTAFLKRRIAIRAGVDVNFSDAFGVAPERQMHRACEAYLESERVHPYRTFAADKRVVVNRKPFEVQILDLHSPSKRP